MPNLSTIHHGQHDDDCHSVVVFLTCGSDYVMVWNDRRGGWEFPGGHREARETIEQTAIREVWEEAGLAITATTRRGHYILPDGHVTEYVTASIADFSPGPLLHETSRVKLFPALPADLSFNDDIYQRALACCSLD